MSSYSVSGDPRYYYHEGYIWKNRTSTYSLCKTLRTKQRGFDKILVDNWSK